MTGPATSVSAPLPVGVGRYALGVGITVVAILSQYFVPENWPPAQAVYDNLPGDLFVVYGIPVLAFAFLVGAGPLRNWGHRMGLASVEGVSWYGVLSLVALFVVIVLAVIYEVVDPAALQQLNRPNPALTQAASDPWFWVGFSFVSRRVRGDDLPRMDLRLLEEPHRVLDRSGDLDERPLCGHAPVLRRHLWDRGAPHLSRTLPDRIRLRGDVPGGRGEISSSSRYCTGRTTPLRSTRSSITARDSSFTTQ